ncbi:hypothetical protein ACLOJK_030573 [Asimina triloba]
MESHQPHVVVLPFMAQGHTIPLLDLSKALSSMGLKITIVTTPSNSPFILQSLSNHSNIHLLHLEFPPIEGLPKGCENTDQLPSLDFFLPFLQATARLKEPFKRLLARMLDARDAPICVIVDFFLGTAASACREFNIPRLVFNGMGAFAAAVCKSLCVHAPYKHVSSDSEPLHMPGMPATLRLTMGDAPGLLQVLDVENDPFIQFYMEEGRHEQESWGLIVNSFLELEPQFGKWLDSFYQNGAKAWCIGPLFLYNQQQQSHKSDCFSSNGSVDEAKGDWSGAWCMDWLDGHALSNECGSVIFVSFGTQTHIPDEQLDEIRHGLEMCGHPFVWVVRSKTWSPPQGMVDGTKGRGLIIRTWSPQRRILAHPAIGGFLSHCGWNSVVESLSVGVPILAWPMIAEQHLNAKLLVEMVGAGERIRQEAASDGAITVTREAICEGVRSLMDGENGKRVRKRATEVSQMAKAAVCDGGSSHESLKAMMKKLVSCSELCS